MEVSRLGLRVGAPALALIPLPPPAPGARFYIAGARPFFISREGLDVPRGHLALWRLREPGSSNQRPNARDVTRCKLGVCCAY